ncbi:conserved unknown protein [Ectocarpus siliculosus]|uniref:CTLH domain-containing protein n=1 Tax=Ectocarpus siliculosus TaxID=2880 RepID=D8LQC3_ECTSI|nr:conserved unknown protein [Ectocarpus siliculosus]|eukprot:CBN78687.1 conserved unknown protein [Ectocarpus siliculosus]
MPVPVTDLLADGGGGGAAGRVGKSRAVALAATLSFRTKLRREILSGNIRAATTMLQRERPGLLEKRADVRFALKCQEFIELVKKGEVTAAVSLAQRDLSRFRDSPRTRSDSPSSFSSSSSAPSPNGSPFRNGHHLDNNKAGGGGGGGGGGGSAPTNSCASSPAASATTAGFGQAAGAGTRAGASSATARSGGVNTRGAAQRRGGPGTRGGGVRGPGGGARSRAAAGGSGRGNGNEGGESEEETGEAAAAAAAAGRRTRKRRSRSYDPVKTTDDRANPEEFNSDNQACASPDRGGAFGGGYRGPADFARRGGFPSTLFGGAPSVYDSKLLAVMGLLAYSDPAASPLGYLVSGLQNQAIADKVNDAVLAADALTRRSNPDRNSSTNQRSRTASSIGGASSNETGNGSGGTAQAAAAAVPTSGLEFAVRHLLATRQMYIWKCYRRNLEGLSSTFASWREKAWARILTGRLAQESVSP